MIRALRAAALLAWLAASVAAAGNTPVACRDLQFDGAPFTICEVDAASVDLRLFLYRPGGAPWGGFIPIDDALAENGQRLAFAMNAGMYHADRSPVGHYVEDGAEAQRLITSAGPGNFGLVPNGVLCLHAGRARVIETLRFRDEAPTCTHATQSGPMLVIDGALHPRFLPDSTSRYVRNGVGTSEDGAHAVFAISNRPVTFHQFGRLFRDALGVRQALYFDGNISRLHAPGLGRSDGGFPMGPIIGAVVPAD